MHLTSSMLIYSCSCVQCMCFVIILCEGEREHRERCGRDRAQSRERASESVSIRHTRVQTDRYAYIYTDRQTCIHIKRKTYIHIYTYIYPIYPQTRNILQHTATTEGDPPSVYTRYADIDTCRHASGCDLNHAGGNSLTPWKI